MGRVRFGIFEFDSCSRELRRDGTLLRLQSQPAQVLALLVEQAGQVVTREALRTEIWGTETFVDFDRGLNFCIAQIRSALGDSAESPRFIRTLPKRGYQFIAPVSTVSPAAASSPLPAAPALPSRRRLAYLAIAAGLLVALMASAYWTWHPRTTRPVRLAVVPFDNETGDPEFDRFAGGLTDAVVAELTNSGGGSFGVIGNAAILRQPRSRRDLSAIASSLSVGYVVIGQVQRSAAHIRVLAHLIHMPGQTHVWVTRMDRTVDDPLRVESEMAQRIGAEFLKRIRSARESSTSAGLLSVRHWYLRASLPGRDGR